MDLHKVRKIALKADVEIHRADDLNESEVYFSVYSPDGSSLTGNQILEAVADALLYYWDNNPEIRHERDEYDA